MKGIEPKAGIRSQMIATDILASLSSIVSGIFFLVRRKKRDARKITAKKGIRKKSSLSEYMYATAAGIKNVGENIRRILPIVLK
jgi:hypothetical protein